MPIFDGENYQIWSVQMRTLLKRQGLWDVITKGYEIPLQDSKGKKSWDEDKQKQYEETQRRDCNTLSLIQRGVTPSIFPRIMAAATAKEVWDILEQAYKGSKKVISFKLQNLWTEFEALLMKEGGSIEAFFNRVSNIVNQIRTYGDTIEDVKIVQKV